MSLSDRAIDYPKVVILFALFIVAIGLTGVIGLPKERKPRIKLPVILVAVPYPGAQPADVERQIIDKIEDNASTIDNLRDDGAILSQSMQGIGLVQFVFNDKVNVTEARRDVESLINRIRGEFPLEAQSNPGPVVADIGYDDWPVIQVFLAGGVDAEHRRRIAERLQDHIEKVPGISRVNLFGGREPEAHVAVDPHTMTLYGFTYEQIDASIRAAVLSTPTGRIESDGGEQRGVEVRSQPRSINDLARIPLGVRDGKPITLADVATVEKGQAPRTSMARYAGEDAVVLLAMGQTDADMLRAASGVQRVVDQFVASGASDGLKVGTLRSQAREINYMISQLGSSGVYGVVLVFLVLTFTMGWRLALLIGFSVPFALLTATGAMWASKLTFAPNLAINNMTLFAGILVTGLVVDGCIVVGENIFRHREMGKTAIDAAKRGINEVEWSLIGAYCTTFAAFGPMFLVRGVVGDFVEHLPTVVIFALLGAMVVDHFVLPVASLYLMPSRGRLRSAEENKPNDERPIDDVEVEQVDAMVAASPSKQRYGQLLHAAMVHRRPMLAIVTVLAITPIGLYLSGALGLDFFPESDMANIEVHFELPLGSAMDPDSVRVAERIEAAVVRAVRPEEWYRGGPGNVPVRPVTVIGDAGPLSIRLDAPSGSGPEFGMVYVELCLREERQRDLAAIRKAIEREIPPMPGVIIRCETPIEGPPAGAPVALRIRGHDGTSVEALAMQASEVQAVLRQVPGVKDVTNDFRQRPEVFIDPNDTVAGLYGISPAQLKGAVAYALEGVRAAEVRFQDSEPMDIRIRNRLEHRDELHDLAVLPLMGQTGQIVQLEQIARLDRLHKPDTIRHRDGKRAITIRAQLDPGVVAEDVKAALLARMRPELSESQRNAMVRSTSERILFADDQLVVEFGGENEIRDDAMHDLTVALAVAMALMLVVLTIQFNSFIQPLIVLFSVPLSLIGVAFGLLVCGYPFSMAVMIGIVALAGIVVNDAIVLVEFINQWRKRGVPMAKAVIYAGQLRLRPILLTTITTVAGLLPLALNLGGGGEFFQPLAVTMIFGLGTATFLQLFLIPTLCYMLDFKAEPLSTPAADSEPPSVRRPLATLAFERAQTPPMPL